MFVWWKESSVESVVREIINPKIQGLKDTMKPLISKQLTEFLFSKPLEFCDWGYDRKTDFGYFVDILKKNMHEVLDEEIEKIVSKYLEGEEFIDGIVERINKKQVSKCK